MFPLLHTGEPRAESPERGQGCLGSCFRTLPAYMEGPTVEGLRSVHLRSPPRLNCCSGSVRGKVCGAGTGRELWGEAWERKSPWELPPPEEAAGGWILEKSPGRVFAYLFAFGFQRDCHPTPGLSAPAVCFPPCLRQKGWLGLGLGPSGSLGLGTVWGDGHPRSIFSPPARHQGTGLHEHIHTGSHTHKCDRGHHSQSRGSRLVG